MPQPIPVSRPHFFGQEAEYVAQALSSTLISGHGPFIGRMEKLLGRVCGTQHAIAVANGTVAIDLALKALGLKGGDEVIVPDFSMFSPIGAVLRGGGRPVPVDADETWNIDPDKVEAAITAKTRGIIMVHTYGQPANGHALRSIADRRGLWIIEDAAEAVGATYDDRKVGSFGDIATLSLYSNKVVTSGEGGAAVTNDSELAARMRDLRNLSFGDDWETRFVHEEVGFNFRLSNVLAAIGCAQLENFEAALRAKQNVAARYLELLEPDLGLEFQPVAREATHSYWVFGVLLPHGVKRRSVATALKQDGIDSRPFFCPVHRQPCLQGMVDGSFPQSSDLFERGLYLPSYTGMDEGEIERVCASLSRILRA